MAQIVFCTWVLEISNHLIHFSLRNGKLNVKKNMPRDKEAWLIASRSRDS